MADKLYVTGLTVESGIVAMVQMLSYAKKLVRGAGGESYVHVLRDDGKVWVKNFRFSPEIEGLYEFFVESGRGLILATGDVTVNDANYDAVVRHFIDAMKAKRTSIVRESGIRPSTSEKLEPGP